MTVTLSTIMNSGLDDLIKQALREDIGSGDLTTTLLVPPHIAGRGTFVAKQDLVVCGLPVSERVCHLVDPAIVMTSHYAEGERALTGAVLAQVSGSYASLLTAERTALNILTHLSGIATLTATFAGEVRGTRARVMDTRKTLPGLRLLEKYAVAAGGGANHRIGLYDGILIKDNHLAINTNIADLVQRARNLAPAGVFIEVEVETFDQVLQAVSARPDIIMLDNMTIEEIRRAREHIPNDIEVEVSGNVRLENVRDIAACGVERISVGALTHSAPAADISLSIEPEINGT